MAYPPAPQHIVKVKYKTWAPILFTVAGALWLVVALMNVLVGTFSIGIITGPLFVLIGILTFSQPLASYELATGALHMHSPLGFKTATYGAPKGERLWFDGTNLMRVMADGRQKKVNLKAGRPEDVAQVVQAVAGAQQQPQQ
ncbi:hypothetical protein GCM10009830_18780 [Glycomyces endophyticus]|uniref:PH domain-containing protein n=1 Tax=Glycomyces endophyticus TaxID=480996 RepID=A0ABN2GKR6_9ACTN